MNRKQLVIQALEEFNKAAHQLSEIWLSQEDDAYDLLSFYYPFEVDFAEIVDAISGWLGDVEQELNKWTSYHTGGGIWCYQKEFTTTDGEKVVVQAFKDGAQIEGSDSFIIDLEEFTTGADYERFTTEQMREITEACLRIK